MLANARQSLWGIREYADFCNYPLLEQTTNMIPSWQKFLIARGAEIHEQQVLHFGDARAEAQHLLHGPIVADLSHLGLIQFVGEEAQTFLQGQLSNDVRQLTLEHNQYTSYNTPKGRMLANGLLWLNAPDSYIFQLPASLRETIQKKLSMYILRAKVKASDASATWVRMGVGGPQARAAVAAVLGAAPTATHLTTKNDSTSVLRLPGENYEILCPPEAAPALWEALAAHAKPAGAACWDDLLIRAGIPTILPATQDQFVAQMVNYELINGVNFKKGCYPGQEIVARTQYLGKTKRRMFLATLAEAASPGAGSDHVPQAGDALFHSLTPDQASGMVVNAAPAPGGGYDVLAVLQTSSTDSGSLHWKSLQGPQLHLNALPYSVPA